MAAGAYKDNQFVKALQGDAKQAVTPDQSMNMPAHVAHKVGEWLITLRAFIHEFAKTDGTADPDAVERFLGETSREGIENLQRYVWRSYVQHYIFMGEQANRQWPNLTKVMLIKQEYVAAVRAHFMLKANAQPT